MSQTIVGPSTMSDPIKTVADRLMAKLEDVEQTRLIQQLVKSKSMAKALAEDMKPAPKVESLSEKRLPTITLQRQYALLLQNNPAKAQRLWDDWARTADQLMHKPPEPLKPMTSREIAEMIEHRKMVREVNLKPLRRRV